ncbi:mimecan [Lates japonicus]|uniref:Mimecan n=1 Tax=Lates japonicus TaxID=270547 RepID=A0AAD3NIW9_LATJO|nr:mimecan [Lates japonicus]
MKALLFTCMLVPWLVAASARRFDQDSQLIPGSLPGTELDGYFSDNLKSRRARYPSSSVPGRDPGISCESWSNLLAEAATSHGTSIQVNKRAFMLSKAV